jgi:fructuronate reductase
MSEEFGKFVKEMVAFPSTMVDRIVPATTDADREAVSAALGVIDAWPVMTEPFTQWIVEEHFPNGRPAWEHAGAVFVSDVTPFELMKLRLLNGSHSTLSYLGQLAGYETVADAMAAPGMADLIDRLMVEASETLPPLEGIDLAQYRADLIARFRNPALRHKTLQIAMDGSQKLPQRLLGTIRDRLRHGKDIEPFALGVAAWMRYATGIGEDGREHAINDPLAGRIKALTAGKTGAGELVAAYLGLEEVFGDLGGNAAFREAVTKALGSLIAQGSAATMASFARPA